MTRYKTLLPVVVLIAAAAAYWFLLLAPKREEAATLQTQLDQAETQVQAAEATAASYEAAKRDYKANYARLAGLGKAVPADDDVRSLLVQINTTSTKDGVNFRTIDAGSQSGATAAPDSSMTTTGTLPGEQAPPPGAIPFGSAGMSVMPFGFTLTGTFGELSKVVGGLEDYVTLDGQKVDVRGRLMRIESLSLVQASAGLPQLRAQINATTYLMPATSGVDGAATTPSTDGTTPPPATAGDATVPQAATITGAAR